MCTRTWEAEENEINKTNGVPNDRTNHKGRREIKSLPGGVGVGTDDTNSVVSGGDGCRGGGGRVAGRGSQMTDNEGCQWIMIARGPWWSDKVWCR